jgi:hypothetical protein
MADHNESPIADKTDDDDKHASAERIAAAASGPGDAGDAADAKPGDAADVPVPSEDAAAGSSETFPPVNS